MSNYFKKHEIKRSKKGFFLPRYQKYLIRTIVFIAVCGTFIRLSFGIDFTDESQYLAEAFGPLVGGTAFITDRLFQQSGSLWATPFFWLFLKITGSTTGLVLYLRILYFSFSVLASITLFRALRKNISFDHSLAIAALPIIYIPFSVPSISYNTMAVILTITSLSLLRLLKNSYNKITSLLLSLTIAMAIFSYPTIGIAYFALFLFEFRDIKFRKSLFMVSLTTTAFLSLLSISVFSIGKEEIERNFALAKNLSLLTPEAKWQVSMNYLSILQPGWIYVVSILLVSLTLLLKKYRFEFTSLPFLAVFYFGIANSLELEINFGFLIYGSAFTLALATIQKFRLRESWQFRPEIFMGVLLGFIMGSTSGNGFINAALGFSIAMIFLVESSTIKYKKFPWVAWISIVAVYIFAQWSFFYRESKLPELTFQVQSGPFYGLMTNSLKNNFLEEIEADLKLIPKNAKSIFIHDSFPAGYAFTQLQPLTFMYYMHPANMTPALRPELIRMFSSNGVRPDVVLETTMVPVTSQSGFLTKDPRSNIYNDPFWNFFKNSGDYRILIEKQYYTIYVRKFL